MKRSSPLSIAVDSNIIFYLVKYNDPALDPDGLVHMFIESTRSSDLVKMIKNEPYSKLPPLLKIKPFSNIITTEDGVDFMGFLQSIEYINKLVKKSILKLYITPKTRYEVEHLLDTEYCKNYVNVIKIKDEDYPDFYDKRNHLARTYVKLGAMEQTFNTTSKKFQPSNDAYIVAEATVVGLDLITENQIHFIHAYDDKNDFERQTKIRRINYFSGYVYQSRNGKTFAPSPMSMAAAAKQIKTRNIMMTDSLNIDEEGYYISKND